MWLTTPVTFAAATSSLTTTAASTTVTGTNTTFLTTLAVGSEIRVGLTSEIRRVTAIASDTSLTVNEAMSVATSNSGWTYQNPVFSILNAGTMLLGGRSQTANTTTAVAQVQGALSVEDGHRIQEGANKWMGVATLSGSTVTVSNTRVTANSRIFLTTQSPSGTVGSVYISARTAGTSFTITSTGAADTSTVAWEIKEPF